MRIFLRFIIFIPSLLLCQTETKTYDAKENSDIIYENSNSKSDRYNRMIHQINLKNDSIFEFRNIPGISCALWEEFDGTYKIQNDTIVFTDKYLLENPDMIFTSKTDQSAKSYRFNFGYDNEQNIDGREIKISFVYDFDSKLKEISKTYTIGTNYSIEIPYEEVENRNELSSFKIVLNQNTSWIIWNYFTVNDFTNKKEIELPNIIDITFIANPKKEKVTRKTKGIINENGILIISSNSKSNLENYSDLILFKQNYNRVHYE